MTLPITKILAEAELLLRNKQYPESLRKLREMNHSSLEGEEYGYYCILLSEAALQAGDYSAICIDDAIEVFRFSRDTEKFAKAKYLKGWHFSSLGKFSEAKETLLEAYVHFLRCNNLHEAARVLNRLSFVAYHSGNIETAIDNLRSSLDIYDRIGDLVTKRKIAHNLASVYIAAGNLTKSLSTYNNYPVNEQEHGDKPLINFYYMSSLPHAFKGDLETAKTTIEKCKPYLDKYPREKAIYFENLGLISILDEDFPAAEEALKCGLEISLEIAPESALVSQIKRLLADLFIATGKFNLAERYAKEALEVAEKLNERVEIAACRRIFAQVEQHRRDVNKACLWYRKAIDLFNLIGARYELAVTRYLAATSGLYYDGERTALLYLAREYFESEGVQHYLDKINTQLRMIQLPSRTARSVDANKTDNANLTGNACPAIITVNPQMKKVLTFAEHVADSEMTVLLTGATGTGKDLLARYIHYHSERTGEFVAVNAAAIPNSMVEAELFGCAKGAYTGAGKDRAGLLEQAEGGTFYLDEIADASPELQAKLLRALETRSVRRLGENKTRRVGFRLIAASNHDLRQRMRENRFRCDLYHRLNEVAIELPSLEHRKDDIPALVRYFLTFAGFDLTKNGSQRDIDRLGKALSQRSWPGNVRQLRSEMRHLWLVSHGDLQRMIDLALECEPTTEVERVLEVLEKTGWNRREAARILGVSEGTIRNRIKKYDLKQESQVG